ncbi:MAG: dipeptidase [Cyanobacteria bacterium P01_D01_bin.6]
MNFAHYGRRFRRVLKLTLLAAAGLVTAMLILVFSLGPTVVAQRFNPVSNQALTAIAPETKALHQSLTVIDLHADSLLWGRDLSQRSDSGHVDIPRLIEGNVALQVFTSVTKVPSPLQLENNAADSDSIIQLALLQRWPPATWFNLTERALYHAQQLKKFAQRSPETFKIIESQADLRDHLTQRRLGEPVTAGLLGIEGAQVLAGRIENVDRLYDAGFRVMGLSHFFDNQVAGSAHGLSGDGLTPFGREAIAHMAALGMIIDLAHASPQAIDDVLQIANLPVLVSHTGVQGTCEGGRNLSDDQLQKIADHGGVIGIGFWQTAVCGEDVGAIVRAIRYVAEHVGVEHVALGSDFDGAVRVPFDVAQMNQITQGLKADGFTDSEIRQVMGLNVLGLLQAALPN